MSSVNSLDRANNWSSIYASALAREKQDEDNVKFMDLREQASREETQRTKDEIRSLAQQKQQLEETVARVNRLERTELEYWEEGDEEFLLRLDGRNFLLLL